MDKIYIFDILANTNINLDNINPIRANYINRLKGKNKILSYLAWINLYNVVKENFNLNINDLNLLYNEYNKPYFENNPFYFNISHSNNLIAIIISNNEVGIDIQLLKDNKNIKRLAKKINAEDDNYISVLKRFSSLEAYYKKIGSGLKPSLLKNNINITYQDIIKYNDGSYVLSFDSYNIDYKIYNCSNLK